MGLLRMLFLSPKSCLPVDGIGHGVVDVDSAAVGDHVMTRSLSAEKRYLSPSDQGELAGGR